MIKIEVSEDIKAACPDFVGIAICAIVKNSNYQENLRQMIESCVNEYRENYNLEDIKNNLAISSTREAYKHLGKDPNRYRPSAEALQRRVIRDLPLYQVNTLVDIINFVSIRTGYSIGGFDLDKLNGNTFTLGVGLVDEPYEAIGRGPLNIENLPVYRDELGGFGTPTSDHERTKLDIKTTHLLTIVNSYNGNNVVLQNDIVLQNTIEYMKTLLEKFASATQIKCLVF